MLKDDLYSYGSHKMYPLGTATAKVQDRAYSSGSGFPKAIAICISFLENAEKISEVVHYF